MNDSDLGFADFDNEDDLLCEDQENDEEILDYFYLFKKMYLKFLHDFERQGGSEEQRRAAAMHHLFLALEESRTGIKSVFPLIPKEIMYSALDILMVREKINVYDIRDYRSSLTNQ